MSSRGAPRGGAARSATPPQGARKPPSGNAAASEADVEIMEFLEGLLEGFRAAAAANAAQGNTGPRQPKWFEASGNTGGKWSDLNELDKSLPQFASGVNAYADLTQMAAAAGGQNSRSNSPVSPVKTPGRPGGGGYAGPGSRAGTPAGGGYPAPAPSTSSFALDPLSTMMRRHALRSFLEETCGSVAKAFEQMATLAVKNSLGSQGGVGFPEQRMKYKFGPGDFQKTLSFMEYGVGAGADWWNALFKSIDVDEDGAISLQDMYDALVLDLPPLPGAATTAGGTGSIYFAGPDGSSPVSASGYSPSAVRGGNTLDPNATLNLTGLFNNECRVCGSELTNEMVICTTCGTRRVQNAPLP